MTEIIKIHYKVSKPVASWGEIKKDVKPMRRFIVLGNFKGFYNKAFAIAHCQVSETPMSFFVVAPEVVKEKMFEADVIINPQIVEAEMHRRIMNEDDKAKDKIITVPNMVEYLEPCMSFPFRKPKRVKRYDEIRVKYQISGLFGLKTIEKTLSGIASEIYQHEFDHLQGKNIYFESETPVKWWELLGKEKSKGGTSLDAPEGLGLSASRETPTKSL